MRICHLTSVHAWNDVRIFLKECRSLADAGYDVTLLAPNCSSRVKDRVTIKCTSALYRGGRLSRFILTTWRTYKEAKSIDADVYHFHDPELIPYGLLLRGQGKRVIYDVHEDVPEDILIKDWIPASIRKPLALIIKLFEDWAAKEDELYCGCNTLQSIPGSQNWGVLL